ncbi:hypothetical protein ABPG77_001011 [Micractinium sp. CCAP 211/92]
MTSPIGFCLLASLLLVGAARAQPQEPQHLTEWFSALAASYTSLKNASQPSPLRQAACGFCGGQTGSEQWPLAGATAALPPGSPLRQSLTMGGCGACLEVQALCAEGGGATGSLASCEAATQTSGIIVTVVDACPGCAGDVLALHPLAASRLGPAPQPMDSIPVRYRQVLCQLPAPILVVVEEYSLQGLGRLRLHLERVGGSGGIKAMWARISADEDPLQGPFQAGLRPQWRQLANIEGTAQWELSGVPPAPLDLLIYPAGAGPLLAVGETLVQAAPAREAVTGSPAGEVEAAIWAALAPGLAQQLDLQGAPPTAADPPAAKVPPATAEPPAPKLSAAAAESSGPVNASVEAEQPTAGNGGGASEQSGSNSAARTVGIAVGAAGAAVVVGLAAALVWCKLARRQRQQQAERDAAATKGGETARGGAAAKLELLPQAYPYWTSPQVPTPQHRVIQYVLNGIPTTHVPPALSTPDHGPNALGRSAPQSPGRLGAATAVPWRQSSLYSEAPSAADSGLGGDVLSTSGGLFAMDRGPSQLDSLASTWYGDGDEQEPVAAAVTLLPATPEGVASSYGSFPLQPLLPAFLPRASAPVLALHRAQGSSLLAAQMAASMPHSLAPAPRPAGSSNAVRSTAEYGRLDAHQREQAERSLVATLQEDEMFVLESGPHSPALSLDSMHSGAAVNTEQHPELPDPAAFWSPAANGQADRHSPGTWPSLGTVPSRMRHSGMAAPEAAAPQPQAGSLPVRSGRPGPSLVRRAEDFTLSADSFTSVASKALFTRDSTDMTSGAAHEW